MKQEKLVTPEYQALLTQMHANTPWGTKGHKHVQDVMSFCSSLSAKSILDYGCGQQALKKALKEIDPNIDVRGYDVGISELSCLPDRADLVVSTDVFEHIEPSFLDNVIEHTFSLAELGVYHHIALTPAKRKLPDGRNAHLIIEPTEWWISRFQKLTSGWRLSEVKAGRKTLKVWFIRDNV